MSAQPPEATKITLRVRSILNEPRNRVILGGGLALRLLALVLQRDPVGLSDPLLYQRFAQGIAAGRGYQSFGDLPTAYYPPGYPFFLGAIQWVCDRLSIGSAMPTAAALVQALLGTVTIAAVIVAGQTWKPNHLVFNSWSVGSAAGAIVALWPNLILHGTTLLSETLYLALFSLLTVGLLQWFAIPTPGLRTDLRAHAAVGLLLGSATLVRPQVLLILPVLVIASLLQRLSWREFLARWGTVALCVAVLCMPWAIRNHSVFGEFVAISTNGGDNLCVGFHEGAGGGFEIPPDCQTGEFYVDGPAAEVRRNAETAHRARVWAANNLSELPVLSLRKLWFTYNHDHDGLRAVEGYESNRFLPNPIRVVLRWLSDIYYYAVAALTAFSAARFLRRADGSSRLDGLIWALTATSCAVPVLFFGDARFKVPAMTLVALIAVSGLARTPHVGTEP